MHNRSQAQIYFDELIKAKTSRFFVAYQGFRGKLRYLDCSSDLKPIFRVSKKTLLKNFAQWGKDQITVGGKTFDIDIDLHSWGLVVFIKSEPTFETKLDRFSDRVSKIHASLKKIGFALTGIVAMMSSFFVFFKDFIPLQGLSSTKPAASSSSSEDLMKLKRVLSQFEIPIANNGIFYWRYEKCIKRILVAGSTNYRENPLDPIEIRFTSDRTWDLIFEAHKQRQPYTVLRADLSPDNALSVVMDELGVNAVVTVPLNRFKDGCPIGYVSTGLFKEPLLEEEQGVVQVLQELGDRIEDWERGSGNGN